MFPLLTPGSNSTIIVSPVQSTTQTAGETLCGLGTGLLVFFHFIAFIVVIVHNRKFDESKVRNKAQVTKGDFCDISLSVSFSS